MKILLIIAGIILAICFLVGFVAGWGGVAETNGKK
jgi:hypothetical protein